jgi:hypothetical protein
MASKGDSCSRLIPPARNKHPANKSGAAGSKKATPMAAVDVNNVGQSKKRLLPLMNNSWDKVCSNQAARCPLIRRRCSFGPLPAGSKINPSTYWSVNVERHSSKSFREIRPNLKCHLWPARPSCCPRGLLTCGSRTPWRYGRRFVSSSASRTPPERPAGCKSSLY